MPDHKVLREIIKHDYLPTSNPPDATALIDGVLKKPLKILKTKHPID